MKKIVLLRHGESTWNKENRFTGWVDALEWSCILLVRVLYFDTFLN